MSETQKTGTDSKLAVNALVRLKSDFMIDVGEWGNNIRWRDVDEFKNNELTEQSVYSVYGWSTPLPVVNQTITGEFEKSFIKFKFVDVEPCGDPPDMFFAKVSPVDQVIKRERCKA